jgi:hypothetical protein
MRGIWAVALVVVVISHATTAATTVVATTAAATAATTATVLAIATTNSPPRAWAASLNGLLDGPRTEHVARRKSNGDAAVQNLFDREEEEGRHSQEKKN